MLYVLYGLLFVLVLFVSEYLVTLTVPIMANVMPGVSTSLLNAGLLSLIALPIILSIFYTQKIIARDFAVRSLQLKISLIGAVPLISALTLILMFFHERFTHYTEAKMVLSTLPQTGQVTEVIHLLEELRDEDYYYLENETTAEHELKHEEVSRLLSSMSEDLKQLADSEDFVYDEFLQVVQTLLVDKVDLTHSNENRESSFEAYTESIRMLSDLRREINFNYQLSTKSQLHDFIRQLDAVREILSIERSLLGKVFERGYFLPAERDTFIQLRTDMATRRLELGNTLDPDLMLHYLDYDNRPLTSQIESAKINLIDESYRKTIIEINRLIGYGGIIHNFKNYVIRKETRYRDDFLEQTADIQHHLNKLKLYFPDSARLDKKVHDIQSLIRAYQNNIQLVDEGISANLSTEAIDTMVKIDDTLAINALKGINQLEVYDLPVGDWRKDSLSDQQSLQILIDSMREQFASELNNQIIEYSLALIGLFLFSVFLIVLSSLLGINITGQVVVSYQQQRQLKKAAEKATIDKSQFLANMSHEIRTPMNGIIGLIQMIQDTSLDSEQNKYLYHIQQSTNSLLRIINDILDYSKLEANKVDIELLPIKTNIFFEHTYNLYLSTCDEKNLEYQLILDPSVPDGFISDSVRLQQIVSNILSNAVKFTSTGRVTITVNVIDEKLCIQIADTGIGMTEEQQVDIFTRFKQADTSTTREYGGTGLGVNIAKELTELMGGELSVKSKIHEGTVFTILLPCEWLSTVQLEESEEFVQEESHQNLDEVSILIVEDNDINLMVVKGFLEKLGINSLYVADNGEKAITTVERLSENNIDLSLILMDCQMPVMDGYEASKILREKGCDIPIIALTANALEGDREKCLEAGMSDFVAKPIEKTHFTEVLMKWVNVKV